MTTPKLWYYRLPSIKGEGWAEIVLGSNGFFAAVSDWGNYAFIWRNPGVDDFRTFMLRATEPHLWQYFCEKLGAEGCKQYDEVATLREVKLEIIARRKEAVWTREEAREEWELLKQFGWIRHRGDLEEWAAETAIEHSYAFIRMRWDHQLKTFCTVTLGRLAELIRAEMAREAA